MELLAPAGSKETFYAALFSGANAIYIGGKQFSARSYCENFSLEDMEKCIEDAHLRNVLVYVTVNTILFEDEIDVCFKECEKYIALGVDAFIIQDIGLMKLIKEKYPTFPLHASTQLSVHNVDEAKFLKDLGCVRVVLAREVNLKTASDIKKETGLEIEVFVHGALCTSLSGNCLLSSFIGKRSGNRGKCAQPCRMEGSIVSKEDKLNASFPLSTKDLCTLEFVKDFKNITSLKIEGRMKSASYIGVSVKAYRQILDNHNLDIKQSITKLKDTFNREFSKGFLCDESPLQILNQKTSSNQGVLIGNVSNVSEKSFFVKLEENLSLHDGLRIVRLKEGFLLTHFKVHGSDTHSAQKGQYVEIITTLKGIKIGDEIIRTKSSEIEKETQQLLNENYQVEVNAFFGAKEGEPFTLMVYEGEASFTATSSQLAQKSIKQFTTKEELANRLNKTGDYPFKLNIDFDIEPGLFYPVSVINDLKRQALDGFTKSKLATFKNRYQKEETSIKISPKQYDLSPIVSIDKEEQFEAVKDYPFSKIFVNDNKLFLKLQSSDKRICYQKKRIGEELSLDDKTEKLSPYPSIESTYISSYANVTNASSVAYYLSRGYQKIVLSYEVSKDNASKILNSFKRTYGFNPPLYYPVYGYIDLMVLKACPIATAKKKQKLFCASCHETQYYYEDRMNVKFPLLGDENCICHMYSPTPLYLKDKIDQKDFGLYFSFTLETKEQTQKVLRAFFEDDEDILESNTGHFYSSPE